MPRSPTPAPLDPAPARRLAQLLLPRRVTLTAVPEHGQRRKATVPLLRTALRGNSERREHQSVAITTRLRVDHPARELAQARLDVRVRQLRELEHPRFRPRRGILLYQQRRLTRVRLPVHLPRRVAFAKCTQPQPLMRPGAALRMRSGFAP